MRIDYKAIGNHIWFWQCCKPYTTGAECGGDFELSGSNLHAACMKMLEVI